jgi:hypothetical protein
MESHGIGSLYCVLFSHARQILDIEKSRVPALNNFVSRDRIKAANPHEIGVVRFVSDCSSRSDPMLPMQMSPM